MAELEELPVEELIRRSLDSSFAAEDEVGNPRSWAAWEATSALAARGGNEVLNAAKCLLGSTDPWRRARGANILGHFQEDSTTSERFDALSTALEVEDDDHALTSLIFAISHLHDPRSLARLLTFVQHPDREFRRAVAMSLHSEWGPAAVAALCGLCDDEWAGVQDWATFKFRTSDVDSAEIRQGLTARLDDPEPVIRAEAICALARRRDLACLKQLVDDLGNLDAWDDYYCHIQAAEYLIGCTSDMERPPEELRDELMRMYPIP